MKKVVYTALCITSVLALPGCWGCQKEEQPAQAVKQEVPAQPEAAKPAEAAQPAEQKPAEAPAPQAVPEKM